MELNCQYIIKAKSSSSRCRSLRKVTISQVYEKTYEFDGCELILIEDFKNEFDVIEKVNEINKI